MDVGADDATILDLTLVHLINRQQGQGRSGERVERHSSPGLDILHLTRTFL